MKQYVLNVIQPDGDRPPPEDLGPIIERVMAWEGEVKAAGAWVFTARLHLASTATVVRMQDGEALMTDGPFAEGKEHIGGFTIVSAPDLDGALDWAQRLSAATTLPIEVRPVDDGE
ncbi:YciI family protein [Actinomadura sp. DC4]|uniref:YciI family protein n=1 Tax=Actinomadura sp. DC4 TaxID=3055069 RepID=UPI0025AFAB08|nr:YciI family protein [Actinomadura sp. DC4]MDN3354048.1 YciI family protein [Actinomadura sp. DC4]